MPASLKTRALALAPARPGPCGITTERRPPAARPASPRTVDLSIRDPDSDLERFRRWQEAGDQAAAAALWRSYDRLAVAVAADVLRHRREPYEDARDICSRCFVKALRTFRPERVPEGAPRPFRGWYLTLVKNAAIDELRRRRPEPTAELPEVAVYPEDDGLALTHEVREVIPQLRAFVLERYLPSDWALFELWMEHEADGRRVPWKKIAPDFPVEIPQTVPFAPQSAALADPGDLDPVVRVLDVCSDVHVQINGAHAAGEPRELALRRADAVREALEARIVKKVTTRRGGEAAERRLQIDARPGAAEVSFEVTRGRIRTPAALRMRVKKVILEKARELALAAGRGAP